VPQAPVLDAPVLEVRNLDKAFGGIRVADDIELSLRPGRILGLIGPNGAGKTSLFNLICGIVRPDRGSVRLDGQPLDGLPPHQRARRGLARTWQHTRLFPSLTVLDNLIIGARQYPGEKLANVLFRPGQMATQSRRNRLRALELLALCGLEDTAAVQVGDLPYGRQKLVGVARTLMGEARCLLLDEPMAGVEGQSYATIQRVVRDVAASGVAVAVVEHNVGFIRDLCDEAVFMFAGRILARGSVRDLVEDRRLTELYFGT
jgi:branched-chain amino acid transport system ATP-binding protein